MACQVIRSFANRALCSRPGDTGELTAQMQRLWQDLPQGVISDLIESMPRRISASRARSGQWTMDMQNRLKSTLKEGLGIRDDPVLHERDQAIEIFKETDEFKKGRYIVQLPLRKPYNVR
ncbi:hypothetical protein TNCV_1758901 [Trichonephila clavipes]|nr:hypothetical protein TNCV_1758901 [Trichonephila clavipes]